MVSRSSDVMVMRSSRGWPALITSMAVISLVIDAIGVCMVAFFSSKGRPLAWSYTSTDCAFNSGMDAGSDCDCGAATGLSTSSAVLPSSAAAPVCTHSKINPVRKAFMCIQVSKRYENISAMANTDTQTKTRKQQFAAPAQKKKALDRRRNKKNKIKQGHG